MRADYYQRRNSGPNVALASTLLFAATLTAVAAVRAATVSVVEYYHSALDHYFVTQLPGEVSALDSGQQRGWARTGRTFGAWPSAADAGSIAANPVCRFYIPPDKGSSHFFSASPAECAAVLRNIETDPNFAGYVQETPSAFFAALPDAASGACAQGTVPVYRLWNRRPDANHRYTTDRGVRAEMIARGWVPEGYGPEGVAMCTPPDAALEVVRVSGDTPFAPTCAPLNGTLYSNAEVEPYLAVNPTNPQNLIGVWQQDRWSNGGARGLMTAASFDGGRTWERRAVPFTRCSGGHPGNGGDYERASDPWVSFGPDGTAWQVALALSGTSFTSGSTNAITVSRSADGGRTWSNPRALIVDGDAFFNDKEAITADPTDARYVYVAWDRLRRTGGGPSYFARTADGGATWEPAREVFDPGNTAQTINNIPVVLSDGTLALFFTRIDYVAGRNVLSLRLMLSPDKGATWGAPITIASLQSVATFDPESGTAVRDAALLGSIAAGPGRQLAVAWQDARFSAGERNGIALSRSFDGGLTWTAPVRINRAPSAQAFIPTVAIRTDGLLGVSYFDFRNNTDDATSLRTDYWLATTWDGTTWRETHLAGPFDYLNAPNANGLFTGDYMALGVRGSEFLPFFATANDGDAANRTDVRIAFVGDAAPAALARRAGDSYRAGAAVEDRPAEGALAERIDAAARAAMQRRVPGWRSPAEPHGRGPPGPGDSDR
ncbi:MAG: glycoside hydrolase [Betaproteobacteria bacterium]|nr:glycoside hydrolase [Betaproteobacteria bacterium]